MLGRKWNHIKYIFKIRENSKKKINDEKEAKRNELKLWE